MNRVTHAQEGIVFFPRRTSPPPPLHPSSSSQPLAAPTKPRSSVRDYDTPAEGREIDTNANIYSLIRIIDFLEAAHNNESVSNEVYADKCKHYLGLIESSLGAARYGSIDEYLGKNAWVEPECAAGVARIKKGCTREEALSAKVVAEITQEFITIVDAVKLDLSYVDTLLPYLKELDAHLDACPGLTSRFDEGRSAVKKWIAILSRKEASYKLGDDERRQLAMDMELSYNEFHKTLDKLK